MPVLFFSPARPRVAAYSPVSVSGVTGSVGSSAGIAWTVLNTAPKRAAHNMPANRVIFIMCLMILASLARLTALALSRTSRRMSEI